MQHVYWMIERELAGRCGPDKQPWDLAELKKAGIGGIVSLCGPVDAPSLQKAQIHHCALYRPMIFLETEQERRDILTVLPFYFDFFNQCRHEESAVLVHCYHGCDRTGLVLACHLVARQGLSATEAVERVRALNPFAMQAYGYEEAVAVFEEMYRSDPALFEA